MFTCILCTDDLADERKTEEHVFPDALGGSLAFFDLCKCCNDHLGHTADAALADHFLVQLARMRLGLIGKTGRLPNPLYHGKDDQGRPFRREIAGDVHQQPRVERSTADNVHVSVAEADEKKLSRIVETIITRARKEGLIPTEVSPPVTTSVPGPVLNFEAQIDLEQYKRGLLKIAYEVAFLALGTAYLDDPVARELRGLLRLERMTREHAATISFQCHFGGLIPSLVPMAGDHSDKLIAAVWQDPAGGTHAYVRVLDTFDTLLRVAADASDRLGEFGKAWMADVKSGELQELTALEILTRWTGPPS